MARIEPPRERAKGRHGELECRGNEAARRDPPALEVKSKLGVKMTGDFRPNLVANGLVTKNDPCDLGFDLDPSAAMVGKIEIVIADDPGPVETRGERGEQLAGVGWEPIAAKAVMEAVAETIDPGCVCTLDFCGKFRERRVRVVGRQELAETRKPACFFKMQISNEKRLLRWPVKRAASCCLERFVGERKGNHSARLTADRPSD